SVARLWRPRPHLVPDRLLRRRDQLDRAALGLDLLAGRLADPVDPHRHLLGQFAVAEDHDTVHGPLGQPPTLEGRGVNDGAVVEGVQVGDVDDRVHLAEAVVVEAALRGAAEQRHLAALEERAEHLGARAGVLALAAAAGGLAVARAGAPADALLLLALVDALGEVGQVHYSFTPRRRATSSRVRSIIRPAMVALTRLIGLVLPWVFVRILRMPQACNTSRTPGPALTPVPGPAEIRITRLAPKRPITRCGMVSPRIDTRFCRLSVSWPSFSAFSS